MCACYVVEVSINMQCKNLKEVSIRPESGQSSQKLEGKDTAKCAVRFEGKDSVMFFSERYFTRSCSPRCKDYGNTYHNMQGRLKMPPMLPVKRPKGKSNEYSKTFFNTPGTA